MESSFKACLRLIPVGFNSSLIGVFGREKMVPPEGDKQRCRHRVTALEEHYGGGRGEKVEEERAAFFPRVSLVFRSDHSGLTLDLY